MKYITGVITSIAFLWVLYDVLTGKIIKNPPSKRVLYYLYINFLLTLLLIILRCFT